MRRLLAIASVALAASLVAVIVGTPAQSSGTYRVDAIFDTAKGIIPGQVVKIAGARVGFVEDVVLTEDYKARIVMSVPRRFAFRADASCNIQPEGLIAENFVQCDPGTPAKRPLEGEPAPTVPVENTSVPVSITDLFRIFQADVRQRFTVAMMAVGGGLAARGEGLNAIIRRSNPTLAAVRRLTADLAGQREQISAAVRDTDLLIARLAERKDTVVEFIEQSERVSAQAAQQRGPLAETIRRLPPLLDRTDVAIGNLNRFLANSRPLLGELRAAAPGLERALIEVGPFARAGGPALERLAETAGIARDVIPDAEPLVGRLRTFARIARPVGRTLGDLLVDLRDSGAVEFLERFVYNSAAATARFDSTSHILPAHAVDGGQCSMLSVTPVAGCNSFFREPEATRRTSQRRRDRGASPAATPQPTVGTDATPPAVAPADPAPGDTATPTVPPLLGPVQDVVDAVPTVDPELFEDLTDFLLEP
jgi:virulence factor Mce-like protein